MNWRRLLKALLYPNGLMLLLLALASALGLTQVFTKGLENTVLAYVVYPVSAYTVLAISIRAAGLYAFGKQSLNNVAAYKRYKRDIDFKARISVSISLGITGAYCLYKSALAVFFRSPWFGSMAAYYFILAALRAVLLRRGKAVSRRACGVLLFVLTLVLGVMSFHAIVRGERLHYPGYMIYAAAAFTFYNLTMAIYSLMRYRRAGSIFYSISKLFSLASALVSLFFLQTGLLSYFGNGELWHEALNMATGGAVFLIILIMSVIMIKKRES